MSKLLFIVLMAIFLLLQQRLWHGQPNVRTLQDLEQKISVETQTNTKLQERNDALEAEVYDLRHNTTALEELAREELGMVQADETFFRIIDEQDKPQ